MSPSEDAPLLVFLKRLMVLSIVGAGVALVVAIFRQLLDGVVARIFLTFLGLFCGSLLMQVQLRARMHHPRGTLAALLGIGVAVIFVSQVSFLSLVWTRWVTQRITWRIWWVSMTPSVFITHLLLLHAVVGDGGSERKAGAGSKKLERITSVCVVWVGLMIAYLGIRAETLYNIDPVFLMIGAVPAAGTIILSAFLTIRWLLATVRPSVISKRTQAAALMMTYLVLAGGGFFLGRATAGQKRGADADFAKLSGSALSNITSQMDRDRYTAMSFVAMAIGDTRIVERPPFITIGQIDDIQKELKPGDIIIERRNWYLSNPFLPGFWPHAALYIGTAGDLTELGIADHPSVVTHHEQYAILASDGRPNTIIEAVSEGVIFNSLTHSLHADYVAVLRPRLSKQQVASAIVRAFENVGKAYDFNFDFEDTSRLVCTQLVYVSYEGMLNFELHRIMGRWALPAGGIVDKFAAERGRDDRQLDFVLFLDAADDQKSARRAGEEDFCDSAKRPRILVE